MWKGLCQILVPFYVLRNHQNSLPHNFIIKTFHQWFFWKFIPTDAIMLNIPWSLKWNPQDDSTYLRKYSLFLHKPTLCGGHIVSKVTCTDRSHMDNHKMHTKPACVGCQVKYILQLTPHHTFIKCCLVPYEIEFHYYINRTARNQCKLLHYSYFL